MYMHHSDGPPCILGRYRLLGRVLGKGNYARVEEAVHLDVDNAHVAVKMIDTHTVKDSYVLRNLEREAKVLQQLKHPNIMAIFEVLRAGSHYCMVTEPVYGGELCAHVNRQARGHLDEATTLVFAAQLISAVAHMHALRVVHRDLKTKNIMLSKRGDQVKIVDFGLGRTWSRTRPLLTHCGSPGYAAPEIYQRDRPYGPEVDLWSLGVVLYYMAVGRMPFPPCRDKGRTAEERRRRLVAMITKGATEHHVKLMSHFSPEFRDLVQGLLTASVPRRMTLEQTVAHPWVANRLRARQLLNVTYRLSSQERALVLTKVAILMKSTVQSIEAQWRQNRLGEVAAMCNILAHKQLATYHASWALRPVSPRRTAVMGAAASQGSYVPKGPPGHRPQPGPSTEADAEAVVDQPPSSAYEGDDDEDRGSAASVMSLDSEHEQASLPPPPRPLALLHAPQDQDEHGQDGSAPESQSDDTEAALEDDGELQGAVEEGAVEEGGVEEGGVEEGGVEEGGVDAGATARTQDDAEATGKAQNNVDVGTTTGAPDNVDAGATARAQSTVETTTAKTETEATGQDTKMDAYVMGCLLSDVNDINDPEQMQPLPETKVMFYTETVLDNIHVAMAASNRFKDTVSVGTSSNGAPPGLPVKSALASQTGLAAKTRKAVSFSIITTTQSEDSAVSEEQHRETGVQANLGNLGSVYSKTASPGHISERPEPAHRPDNSLAQSVTQTTVAESPLLSSSATAQREKSQEDNNVGVLGATSLYENNIGSDTSSRHVELQVANEKPRGPSTQDARPNNSATAVKFLKTVSLSRKVSPEPKKNIFEARRWPFRSPRLVYQRMKSQSNMSVSYFLNSQESLTNKTAQQENSSPAMPTVPTHSTVLPAHPEESGEDDSVGSHVRHETCPQDNLIPKGKPTIKPKEMGNNTTSASESEAHDEEKMRRSPSNQDSQSTQRPLHTVADIVRTKLSPAKEKNTDKQHKEQVQEKPSAREKRRNPIKYRRFFPNKYRIDLALVMTLERSRKSILPSIHGPWTPRKLDK